VAPDLILSTPRLQAEPAEMETDPPNTIAIANVIDNEIEQPMDQNEPNMNAPADVIKRSRKQNEPDNLSVKKGSINDACLLESVHDSIQIKPSFRPQKPKPKSKQTLVQTNLDFWQVSVV